ncbi:MAG: hypothetical protein KF878_37800 [Planctomycetes bacterium]|nr:hypothetical protein [Planctomycetota bacterium]
MARTSSALLVAAVIVGCAGPAPAPPPADDAALGRAVSHYAGSAVSGPAPVGSDAVVALGDPDAALQVRVTWAGLDALPDGVLEPIARRRRLLVDLDGVDALGSVPALSAGARAGEVAEADVFLGALGGAPLGELRAAVPVGATGELSLVDERASGARARVAVRVRAAPRVDVALLLEHVATRPPQREPSSWLWATGSGWRCSS